MATTLTLTIGGVNFLPRYVTGSARISESINNQGNSLTMSLVVKTGQALPSIGSEIVFKDGVRYLFGGYISKLSPREFGVGQLIEYRLEATDYTSLLQNKNAGENYTNVTLRSIVIDVITKYVNSGYGVTYANTATGPTITTVAFNHISLRKCFENLAKLSGFIWWIDYQKDVHFIDPGGANSAPEQIRDDAPTNYENVNITLDVSQVRNNITILGGTTESSSYPQVILGDANAREWVLLYPVRTMTSIELDTGAGYVSKTFGVDPVDDELSFYFMYSPTRGSIRASSGSATPGATHKIRVTYTYPLPVISQVSDAISIAALKAIEGGDGLHSYTIQDTTILSSDQAQKRALKELDQFSNPILSGMFRTRTGLLSVGSYFIPGQALTVNLPSWGISTNTTYTIQKVMTTLVESGNAIEYIYEVTFGGRLLGVVDFLIALGTPELPLDTSGQVLKIKSVSELLNITETITRNGNVRSIAESFAIAETISKANVTPPFKWGVNGTANKGIWGKSEWA